MSDFDRCVRGSLLMMGVVCSSACGLFGPSESVDGLWQGSSRALGMVTPVYLTLRQDGNRITGLACGSIYQSEAVLSKYPYVTFGGWEGKLEKSGAIVSTKISDLEKFTRTDTAPPGCF